MGGYRTRFAPSTTGEAHPGTLMSALLCWLDARSRGGEVWLRLEDLDPERSRPALADAMERDLAWLGLDWDRVERQSDNTAAHEAALDRLAGAGHLYPCGCSRSRLKSVGRPAPDGGFAYDNTCRARPLPPGGWRDCAEPLRVRLPDHPVALVDASGRDLSQHPARDMGDPVVRRRDGAFAYHLACVVDDHASGITHLIRGHDLAASAATQMHLQDLLGFPRPAYRHHFLFLEQRGGKMAKLHGAVGLSALRSCYDAPELCGLLLAWAGVLEKPEPCRPADAVSRFDWSRVRKTDMILKWDGQSLVHPSDKP